MKITIKESNPKRFEIKVNMLKKNGWHLTSKIESFRDGETQYFVARLAKKSA